MHIILRLERRGSMPRVPRLPLLMVAAVLLDRPTWASSFERQSKGSASGARSSGARSGPAAGSGAAVGRGSRPLARHTQAAAAGAPNLSWLKSATAKALAGCRLQATVVQVDGSRTNLSLFSQ